MFNFDANITKKMLSKYGLPHTHNFSPEKILSNMKNDKKNWYNETIMVIPKDVNEMEIMNVEEDLVIETLSKTRESWWNVKDSSLADCRDNWWIY